jgi:hypothetical protein
VQEAGWAPGPVWTGEENLAPTGILSPDCPARSQLLYRLSYRAHFLALLVISVLLNVLQLAWHSFESVATQLFFDVLVKMTVLGEINFIIKGRIFRDANSRQILWIS